MHEPSSFGEWIRQRRKRLDLTQENLARRVGCSLSAIRKIESDERRPSKQVAELLAKSLEVPSGDWPAFVRAARGERNLEWLASNPVSLESGTQTGYPGRSQAQSFPAPGPQAAPETNPVRELLSRLPAPANPIVGREPELARLELLLHDPDCRLINLVGPGGIGKTRIAVEYARRAARLLSSQQADQKQAGAPAQLFSDGVAFVPLAAVESAEHIPQAVSDAVGFRFFSPEEPGSQLASYLRLKNMLLVLDNLEHLPGSTAIIGEILTQAPGVKILATSRAGLNLQGEWIFEISGLPVPDSSVLDEQRARQSRSGDDQQPGSHPPGGKRQSDVWLPSGVEEHDPCEVSVEDYSSLAMFSQCARHADPDFQISDENLCDVVRICQIVEGMPLAIELAATWVRVLSPAEIAAEIERSVDFLQSGARDIPERHRSLRAAFDQSWRLLSDEEREVMQAVAVFRGGARREAAQEVAGASLSMLSALVNKSLLRRVGGAYQMHPLVHQYATSFLAKDPAKRARLEAAHCRYYARYLQERWNKIRSSAQRSVVQQIEAEIDNIRQAWDWAVQNRDIAHAWKMAPCLYYQAELRGGFMEGIQLFRKAVEAFQFHVDRAEGRLTLGMCQGMQAYFLLRSARQEEARPLFRESLTTLAPLVPGEGQAGQADLDGADLAAEGLRAYAYSLMFLATAEYHLGDYQSSLAHLDESQRICQQAADRWGSAYSLLMQGVNQHALGDPAAAYELLQRSDGQWRQIGDPRGLTLCLSYFSLAAHGLGRLDDAREMLYESLAINHSVGDRWGMATTLNHLGQVVSSSGPGRLEEALSLLEEAVRVFREMGELWSMARGLVRLGEVHLALDRPEEGREYLREALDTAWRAGNIPVAADALLGLARLLAKTGDPRQAYMVAGQLSQASGISSTTIEQAGRLAAELASQVEDREPGWQSQAAGGGIEALIRSFL